MDRHAEILRRIVLFLARDPSLALSSCTFEGNAVLAFDRRAFPVRGGLSRGTCATMRE